MSSTKFNPRRNLAKQPTSSQRRGRIPKNVATKADVKRLIMKESAAKHHDFETTAAELSRLSTNAGSHLSAIPQQSTAANDISREGTTCNPDYLHLKVNFSVGLSDSLIRMIIIRWKDYTTSIGGINVAGVLDPVAASNSINYVLNPVVFTKADRERFDLLEDRTFVMNNNNDTQLYVKNIQLSKAAKKQISFDADSTTAGLNMIKIYFLTDASDANEGTVQVVSRLHFKDL